MFRFFPEGGKEVSQLILASASPRRRQLLQQIGLDFRIVAPEVSEVILPTGDIATRVMELAYRKAQAVANQEPEGLVLGADTVVVLGDQVLGKPRSADEAFFMLKQLQGREHRVITGVALVEARSMRYLLGREITRIWMRKLSSSEIESYVATGEPLDKAGAYGIQGKGALLVERIEGCYFNVVGLPLVKVAVMLARFGFDIWESGRRDRGEGRVSPDY